MLHFKNKIKEQDLILERTKGHTRTYLDEINAINRELSDRVSLSGSKSL